MVSTHSLDIVTTILDADTLPSPPPCARGSRPRRLAQSADSPPTRHLHATPQMRTADSQAYANATSAVLQGPRHRLCGIFRCGIFASWCGGGGGNCGCRGADGGGVAAADGVCVREGMRACAFVSVRGLSVPARKLALSPCAHCPPPSHATFCSFCACKLLPPSPPHLTSRTHALRDLRTCASPHTGVASTRGKGAAAVAAQYRNTWGRGAGSRR